MAQAHFVNKAQKNIYENGKEVKYVSKKGKQKGETLTKLDRTLPENKKDKILIKKGESYWWWQFKGSDKSISKEKPKDSELTRSEYLSTLYGIQERIQDISADDADGLQSEVEEITSELEELRDAQEEKKSNMPDSLQEGPIGELLQERYDALDSAISELEGIDLEYDEPEDDDIRQELVDDVDEKKDQVTDVQIEDRKAELLAEWVQEKVDEIQGVSFD